MKEADYQTYINSSKTFSEWLRTDYSSQQKICGKEIASLDELPWLEVQVDLDHGMFPKTCLGSGNICKKENEESVWFKCPEPEYIVYSWKFAYEHVNIFAYASTVKSGEGFSGDFWNEYAKLYQNSRTKDWKEVAGPLYNVTICSYFDFSKGVKLNKDNITVADGKGTFCVVSGMHGYFGVNAYQYLNWPENEYEIMLQMNA